MCCSTAALDGLCGTCFAGGAVLVSVTAEMFPAGVGILVAMLLPAATAWAAQVNVSLHAAGAEKGFAWQLISKDSHGSLGLSHGDHRTSCPPTRTFRRCFSRSVVSCEAVVTGASCSPLQHVRDIVSSVTQARSCITTVIAESLGLTV